MGLDNGIYLQDIKREQIKFPWFVILPFDRDYDDRTDICYWRKCWGIRNEIRSILHMSDNEYEHEVEEDDVPAIVRKLEDFLDEEYWENNADSIWEYDEFKPCLLQQIKNLLWLREYLKEHPNVKCYFYDSY
jgi:hypothetical protein